MLPDRARRRLFGFCGERNEWPRPPCAGFALFYGGTRPQSRARGLGARKTGTALLSLYLAFFPFSFFFLCTAWLTLGLMDVYTRYILHFPRVFFSFSFFGCIRRGAKEASIRGLYIRGRKIRSVFFSIKGVIKVYVLGEDVASFEFAQLLRVPNEFRLIQCKLQISLIILIVATVGSNATF